MTAMQNMQCAIAALDTRTKNFDKLHGEVQNLQASLAALQRQVNMQHQNAEGDAEIRLALSNRIYALEQDIKGTVKVNQFTQLWKHEREHEKAAVRWSGTQDYFTNPNVMPKHSGVTVPIEEYNTLQAHARSLREQIDSRTEKLPVAVLGLLWDTLKRQDTASLSDIAFVKWVLNKLPAHAAKHARDSRELSDWVNRNKYQLDEFFTGEK